MSTTGHSNSNESNPCVISVGPNDGCWQCEQPLPVKPLLVIATILEDVDPHDQLFVICSGDCARQVCDELMAVGVKPKIVGRNATRSWLRNSNIVAFVEGWTEGENCCNAIFTGLLAIRRTKSLIAVIQ